VRLVQAARVRSSVSLSVRPTGPEDKSFVDTLVRERWGAEVVVTRGRLLRPSELAGFISEKGGEAKGLITYEMRRGQCEVVTLDSLEEGLGIGTALIEAVCRKAKTAGCSRVWLITTNDNLKAVRFYQKRGFVLAALHRNAIAASRKLKPSIPRMGEDGIPIRDEIELEMVP
jgi:GNAT superfamily N-acetyltransferase